MIVRLEDFLRLGVVVCHIYYGGGICKYCFVLIRCILGSDGELDLSTRTPYPIQIVFVLVANELDTVGFVILFNGIFE